jgi:hypothetical protein
MADKKIDLKVLKMYHEGQSRGNKVRLQVVSWNNRTPVLEKREFWVDATDTGPNPVEKPGKMKGLNIDDLEVIEQNIEEIKKFLEEEVSSGKPPLSEV